MTAIRSRAFTLIEAVAVLVLIGLMASAATLSLRGAYRGSQMKDVVSRVKALDRSARNLAQISGIPGVIRIDRSKGTISYTQDKDKRPGLLPVVLPGGYQITEVRAGAGSASAGTDRVVCTANGQTPTYTLSLAGPNEHTRLLVFSGMTGQITELEDDARIDLNKLLSPRPDTD